jgi:hypothetical protein
MPMTEGVIADDVASRMNSPDQIRRTLRLLADSEKRCLRARLLQCIEHARRPLRIGTVVECEIDITGAQR